MTSTPLGIAGLLGITLIVLLSIWAYVMSKDPKYKDHEIGEIIQAYLLSSPVTILMFLCVLINVAEAIYTASITPVGESPINGVARFFAHMTCAFVSVFGGLAFIMQFRTFFKSILSIGTTGLGKVLVHLFLFVIAFIFAVGGPYGNYQLVVNALEQSQELNILYISWFGSELDFVRALARHQLPMSYNAWEAVDFSMGTTMIMTLMHVLIIAFESLHALVSKVITFDVALEQISKKKDKKGVPDDPDDDDKDEEKEAKPEDKKPKGAGLLDAATRKVLTYYGLDGKELEDRVLTANKSLSTDKSKLPETTIVKLLTLLHALASRVDAAKDKVDKSLIKEIADFWAGSSTNGKGLGITLKKSKNA